MEEQKGIVTQEMLNCLKTGNSIFINIGDKGQTRFEVRKHIQDKDFAPNDYATISKDFNGFKTKFFNSREKEKFSYADFNFSINMNHAHTIWDILKDKLKIGDILEFRHDTFLQSRSTYDCFSYYAKREKYGKEDIFNVYQETLYLSVIRKGKYVIKQLPIFDEKLSTNRMHAIYTVI